MCSTIDYRRKDSDDNVFQFDASATDVLESCVSSHNYLCFIDDEVFEDELLSLLKDEYTHPASVPMDIQHGSRSDLSGSVTKFGINQIIDQYEPYRLDEVEANDNDVTFSDTDSEESKASIVFCNNLQHQRKRSLTNKISIKKNKILTNTTVSTITTPIQRRGDIRMNRAIVARLHNPRLSIFDALIIGGFIYPESHCNDLRIVDNTNITLGQRKNQICRRLRSLREQCRQCRQEQEKNQCIAIS